MLNNLSNFKLKSAKGLYLKGDKKLLDFSLGAGVHYFGHSNPNITAAICMQRFKSNVTGCVSDIHEKVESQLKELLPDEHHNFVFCSSGMEATTKAVRYARAMTGKKAVVSIKGGWHGQNDWTLELESGIPSINRWHISKGSDLKNLSWRQIACVIYEPIRTSDPFLDLEFLSEIEHWCKKENSLTICDEIVTGFRCTNRGLYSELGLSPDIVCYGKILGGGMPISLITMTNEVTDQTFKNKNKKVSSGGTFSANDLSLAAASASLDIVKSTNYRKSMKRYRKLLRYANKKLKKAKIKGFGPVWRLSEQLKQEDMIKRGIFYASNGVIHLSPLTKKSHIKKFVKTVNELT